MYVLQSGRLYSLSGLQSHSVKKVKISKFNVFVLKTRGENIFYMDSVSRYVPAEGRGIEHG
jgi:hypothetical protein